MISVGSGASMPRGLRDDHGAALAVGHVVIDGMRHTARSDVDPSPRGMGAATAITSFERAIEHGRTTKVSEFTGGMA